MAPGRQLKHTGFATYRITRRLQRSANLQSDIVAIAARDALGEELQGWVAALCTTSRAMDAVVRPLLVDTVVIASPRAWCALVDACRLDKDMLSAAGKSRFSRTHELMVTISDEQLGESLRLPRDAFCSVRRFGGPFTLFAKLAKPWRCFYPRYVSLTSLGRLDDMAVAFRSGSLKFVTHLSLRLSMDRFPHLHECRRLLKGTRMPRLRHMIIDPVTECPQGAPATGLADHWLENCGRFTLTVRNASGGDLEHFSSRIVDYLQQYSLARHSHGLWPHSGTKRILKSRQARRGGQQLQLIETQPDPIAFGNAYWATPVRSEYEDWIDGSVKCAMHRDLTDDIRSIALSPCALGGWSDVYRATWKSQSGEVQVAVKVVRTTSRHKHKINKRLQDEIRIWAQLDHPHILPFHGVHREDGRLPALVSPWSENGDICNFLAGMVGNAVAIVRLNLLEQVLEGLEYLHNHKPSIVHGDLKGGNILISERGQAQLCDFGLATLEAEETGSAQSPRSSAKGTYRYMSHELLLYDDAMPSKFSDIWAFGCVVYEVLSGRLPFYEIDKEPRVILAVTLGQLPSRPLGVNDAMWKMMQSCWRLQPGDRATVRSLLEQIQHILWAQMRE